MLYFCRENIINSIDIDMNEKIISIICEYLNSVPSLLEPISTIISSKAIAISSKSISEFPQKIFFGILNKTIIDYWKKKRAENRLKNRPPDKLDADLLKVSQVATSLALKVTVEWYGKEKAIADGNHKKLKNIVDDICAHLKKD